jgi:hypothetical protein
LIDAEFDFACLFGEDERLIEIRSTGDRPTSSDEFALLAAKHLRKHFPS